MKDQTRAFEEELKDNNIEIRSFDIESGNKITENASRNGNIIEYTFSEAKENEISTKNPEIHIFIHGGYWQASERRDYLCCGKHLYKNNKNKMFCLVGYDYCPNQSVEDQILMVAKGIELFLGELDKSESSSSTNIVLSGHSAGAHLVVMSLIELSDPEKMQKSYPNFKKYQNSFQKLNLIAGLYDCQPLVKTTLNDPIKWSFEDAKKLSPIFDENFEKFLENFLKNSKKLKINFYVGEFESDEFKNHQAKQFLEKIKVATMGQESKIDLKYEEIVNSDHFYYIENLVDSEAILTKKLMEK